MAARTHARRWAFKATTLSLKASARLFDFSSAPSNSCTDKTSIYVQAYPDHGGRITFNTCGRSPRGCQNLGVRSVDVRLRF